MNEILSEIDDFLVLRITLSNCVALFNLGHVYHLNKLRTVSLGMVCTMFDTVAEEDDITALPVSAMEEILTSSMLVVRSEDVILAACLKWMNAHREGRRNQWKKLKRLICFDDCTESVKLIFVDNDYCRYICET